MSETGRQSLSQVNYQTCDLRTIKGDLDHRQTHEGLPSLNKNQSSGRRTVMSPSPPTRHTVDLPNPVRQRLNSYALAAGAAGVSALALGQPAEARIICTPTNVQIGTGTVYNLDLNNDKITDVTIVNTSNSFGRGHFASNYLTANAVKAIGYRLMRTPSMPSKKGQELPVVTNPPGAHWPPLRRTGTASISGAMSLIVIWASASRLRASPISGGQG